MSIADQIRHHIFADDTIDHVRRYFSGEYSGAWFEVIDGGGDRDGVADHFTPADLVAVTMLNVRVSGWGAIEVLDHRAEEFSEMLQRLPRPDVDLHTVEDPDLEPLWEIQAALDQVPSIGHVVRSKLLARKRPRLVPIRDQYVLTALIGRPHGDFTVEVRDALREEDIRARAEQVRTEVGRPDLSLLRVVDVATWMRVYGDESVPDGH